MKSLIIVQVGKQVKSIEELNNWDESLFTIIGTSKTKQNESFFFQSNNSGALILLLLYINKFRESGLENLWLQYDISEGRCMIPLHLS